MTDQHDIAPDPFVQTALQLLPVPDHRPEFWAELDRRLDAEPDAPSRMTPRDGRRLLVAASAGAELKPPRHQVPDTSLALLPAALRRRSNGLLAAVAVAAAAMVVVAGTSLVRQRAGEDVDTVERASAEDAGDEQRSSTSVATLTGAAAAAPTEAVLAWVAAVASRDTGTAWDALGPASKAHFGSEGAFEAASSDLVEGYGAWSGVSPEDVLVTPLPARDGGELVVVTLVGSVSQEGTMQHRAAAFPVRMVDGTPRVEPFAFAGELEIVVPAPPGADGDAPRVQAGDDLVVVVPRGVEAPTIRLDDGDPLVCGDAEGTELTELEDAPGQRCSYHPKGGIRAGTRVLTVAFVAPDGAGVAAESVLFEAA